MEEENPDCSKPDATQSVSKKKGGRKDSRDKRYKGSQESSASPDEDEKPESIHNEKEPLSTKKPTPVAKLSKEDEVDLIERRLMECVDGNDFDGIEAILFELKGVPGRAAVCKNAKKALSV